MQQRKIIMTIMGMTGIHHMDIAGIWIKKQRKIIIVKIEPQDLLTKY